jgi:hypothetical protein
MLTWFWIVTVVVGVLVVGLLRERWRLRGMEDVAKPGDQWTHGGQMVHDGEWAAWRLRGNLTQANVESLNRTGVDRPPLPIPQSLTPNPCLCHPAISGG